MRNRPLKKTKSKKVSEKNKVQQGPVSGETAPGEKLSPNKGRYHVKPPPEKN